MEMLGYRHFYALFLLSLPLILAQPKLNIKIPDSRIRAQEISEQLMHDQANNIDSPNSQFSKQFFKQDHADHLFQSHSTKSETGVAIDRTAEFTHQSEIEMVKDWMSLDHQSWFDELETIGVDLEALEKERNSYEKLNLDILEEYQRLSRKFESIVLKEANNKKDIKKKFLKAATQVELTDEMSQKIWNKIVKKVRLANTPYDERNGGLSHWSRFLRFIYWKTLKIFSPANFRRKKALQYLDKLELMGTYKGSSPICIALKELMDMNDEGLRLEDRFNSFIISLYKKFTIDFKDPIVTELTKRAQMRRNILPEDAKTIIRSHKRLLEQSLLNLNFSPRNEIEVSVIDSVALEPTIDIILELLDTKGRKRFGLLKSKEYLSHWMEKRLAKTNWILKKVERNLDLNQDETFTVWGMLEDLQNMARTSIELSDIQRENLKKVLEKVGFNETFINLQKAELYLIKNKNDSGPDFDDDSRDFLDEVVGYIYSSRPWVYKDGSEDLVKELVRRVDKRTDEDAIIVMKTSVERLRKDLEGLDQLKMMRLRRQRARKVKFEPSPLQASGSALKPAPAATLTKAMVATMRNVRSRMKDKVTKYRFALTERERQEIQGFVEKASDKIKAMEDNQLAIEMLQIARSKDFMIPIRKGSKDLLAKLLKDEKLSPLEALTVHSIAQDYLYKIIGRMNKLELALFEMSSSNEQSSLYYRLSRNCLTIGEIYVLSEAQERSDFVSRKEWLVMLLAIKDKESLRVVPETLRLNGVKGYRGSMSDEDELLVLRCAELVSREIMHKIGGSVNFEQVSGLITALGFGRATVIQLLLLMSQLKETELEKIQQVHREFIVNESVSAKEAYDALLPIFQSGKLRLKVSKETSKLEVMRKKLARKEETDLRPQRLAALYHFNLVDTWNTFLKKQLETLGLDADLH
ncbi:uncharacterized protein MELLADRAFT_105222 [Melampsora larici-populina 98AG31]|uniref:Secreted protein n=1 Tax=Melampsora larici-populina (strain 98AG31 / pathotype 3-4-7) TaxID=747676 RepID=F4RH38_MELLP|nr:uncharacterized protein MELLADRAFT_105222 [Melampsora larici-populina 98AG31]EGG08297.1 hypothetical protein MELLADRAFT_105222 [Melampsora larici-populina 98AG31]